MLHSASIFPENPFALVLVLVLGFVLVLVFRTSSSRPRIQPPSLNDFLMAAEGTRLFVGNLAWGTTDRSLHDAFDTPAKTLVDAKVITDRYTGRSRGFGFVTYESPEDATQAIDRMNGVEVDGRAVRVDRASSNRSN